ncbi:MAG: signal peptide peptidase SppA [Spirochaetaceae bacterium]|nr:MAG: signal peptide peptidase SppA [Spirochaetaceae bacterium]
MRKSPTSIRTAVLLTLLFVAAGAHAYGPSWGGTAVHEGLFAARVNPAALGIGNATGVGVSVPWEDSFRDGSSDFTERWSLFLNLPALSYTTERFGTSYGHDLSMGFGPSRRFLFGGSWSWENAEFSDGRATVAALFRPTRTLSLSAVRRGVLRSGTDTTLGLGLRPFAILGPIGTRLTFGLDWNWNDDHSGKLALSSMELEPSAGVRLSLGYDHLGERLTAGLQLSLSQLEIGTQDSIRADSDVAAGSAYLFLPYRRRRSITREVVPSIIVYEHADRVRTIPTVRPWDPGRPYTAVIEDIEALRVDNTVTAVLFVNQRFQTSFANQMEIYEALLRLRQSGKRIYYYFDNIPHTAYALAAATADAIYLHPTGTVDARGFRYSSVYLGDFFARYGVEIYNFRSHPHKSGWDMLSEAGMSDAERENWESYLGDLDSHYREMVRAGRASTLTQDLDAIIDRGPYLSANSALDAGLVDSLIYQADVEERVTARHRFARLRPMDQVPEMQYDWAPRPLRTVKLIYAAGDIVPGRGVRGVNIGADSLIEEIRSARENPLVSGIILRIDSGGGSAQASDSIAYEIARTVEEGLPVVVSMGALAASGGYYIAAPASHIVAGPSTLTGSIGVISIFPNVAGLLEMFDVGVDSVLTSPRAGLGNPFERMSDEERMLVEGSTAESYRRFVEIVAASRGLSVEHVESIAGGRIWSGSRALEIGLVDEVGGLTDAVRAMRRILGVSDLELREVIPGPFSPALAEFFVSGEGMGLGSLIAGSIPLGTSIPAELRQVAQEHQRLMELSLLEPGRPLYVMPYRADWFE